MVLFDGVIDVHYGYVTLSADGSTEAEHVQACQGQANGLLGAAIQGVLTMVTGLHTGGVPLTVAWHEHEPLLDDSWPDVVEASFDVPQSAMVLSTFEDFRDVGVPATGSHRARFAAREMDAGNELDTPEEDEAAPDSFRRANTTCSVNQSDKGS